MNLTNYYWYFQSAIPHRICDEISKYGKSIQDQMAVTGGFGDKKLNQKQIKDLKKKRDSNIVWMSDRWVYKEIQPYMYIKQMQVRVGISNGIFQKLVSLQNIKKV